MSKRSVGPNHRPNNCYSRDLFSFLTTNSREYKRLKLMNNRYDRNVDLKPFISNSRYVDNPLEPFYTVFVSHFDRPKPNKQEIYDFFVRFGPIVEIFTNCDQKACTYAFIRFEKSEDALRVSELTNVRFTSKHLRDVHIIVAARPQLCCNEGIEDIASVVPIDRKLIIEKLVSAEDFEQQIDVLRNEVLLTTVDGKQRRQLMVKFESILNENYMNCKFHIFGSSVNKLGFRDTDIDVFIEFVEENNMKERMSYDRAMYLLRKIRHILQNRLKMFVPKLIESKRCPLLRVDFKHFSDNLRSNGITCDLTLTNSLGIRNSKLMRFLCESEPRFQSLAIIVRYLAKMNGFIGSSQMSSYSVSMLVLFFCQKLKLLPPIHVLMQLSSKTHTINGIESGFCTDIHLYRMDPQFGYKHNDISVKHMLKIFFNYFADFDFTERVICPRFGKAFLRSRFEKLPKMQWNVANKMPFVMNPFCCIQDPFDLTFNLTTNMRYHTINRLINYFKLVKNNSDLYFADIKIEGNGLWGLSQFIETQMHCTYDDLREDNFEDNNNEMKFIGKIEVNFSSKQSDEDLQQKLNDMTKRFTKLVYELLSVGYRFDINLMNKCDVEFGKNTSFAQLKCKFRSFDDNVIDIWKRESALNDWNRESALNDSKLNLKDYGFIEKEKIITEKIIRDTNADKSKSIPFHITFGYSLDTTSSVYRIYFDIFEIKPNANHGKDFIHFINRSIRLMAKSKNIFVIDDDLFITKSYI